MEDERDVYPLRMTRGIKYLSFKQTIGYRKVHRFPTDHLAT